MHTRHRGCRATAGGTFAGCHGACSRCRRRGPCRRLAVTPGAGYLVRLSFYWCCLPRVVHGSQGVAIWPCAAVMGVAALPHAAALSHKLRACRVPAISAIGTPSAAAKRRPLRGPARLRVNLDWCRSSYAPMAGRGGALRLRFGGESIDAITKSTLIENDSAFHAPTHMPLAIHPSCALYRAPLPLLRYFHVGTRRL